MKRNLMLVCLRGAVATLQPAWRCAAGHPQQGQHYRPNRQTSGSSEPAHQNYPRPRFFDKEVATRIPDTISSNQQLGNGTSGGPCRFCQFVHPFPAVHEGQLQPQKKAGGGNLPSARCFGQASSELLLWFLHRFLPRRRPGGFLFDFTFPAADQSQSIRCVEGELPDRSFGLACGGQSDVHPAIARHPDRIYVLENPSSLFCAQIGVILHRILHLGIGQVVSLAEPFDLDVCLGNALSNQEAPGAVDPTLGERLIVFMFLRTRRRSSVLRSGLFSTASFTSASVRLSPLPNPLTSI